MHFLIVRVLALMLAGCWLEHLATPAYAWGAATHIHLAGRLLELHYLLPAALAGLLGRHAASFLYGNTAADVVLGKKFCRAREHCHNWAVGFSLLSRCREEDEQAFGYGYLCHLAADTVAHNVYVPRQIVLSGTTQAVGHLYWEMRADAALPDTIWPEVRRTLATPNRRMNALLEAELAETILPFKHAVWLFRKTNLLNAAAGWQQGMRAFERRLSRHTLDRALLLRDHEASLHRMLDLLQHGSSSEVLRLDPVGNAAFAYVRHQKRHLQRVEQLDAPRREAALRELAAHFDTSLIRPV